MTDKKQHCDVHDLTDTSIKYSKLLKINDMYICDVCINKLSSKLHSSKKDNSIIVPTIKAIMDSMNKYVVGQLDAKKILAISIRNHYKRLQLNDKDVDKSNILLLGSSGTGKTALLKSVSKDLDVPMFTVDISSYSGVGYKGMEVSEIIVDFYKKERSKSRVEKGIVFIDEIDKKKRRSNTGGNDISGEAVQQELLKLIEGVEIEVDKGVFIDTSKILFVAAGAFTGIGAVVNKRLNEKSASIGFLSGEKKEESETYNNITNEDLINYGLIPELVGRFPTVTNTNTLLKEEIISIITEPANSIIKQYTKLFELDNIKLTVDDESIDYLADKVMKNKVTGVRAIRTLFENVLVEIQYDMDNIKDKGYTHIKINRNTFEHNEKPKLSKQCKPKLSKQCKPTSTNIDTKSKQEVIQ